MSGFLFAFSARFQWALLNLVGLVQMVTIWAAFHARFVGMEACNNYIVRECHVDEASRLIRGNDEMPHMPITHHTGCAHPYDRT